jgi:hypothetical protein
MPSFLNKVFGRKKSEDNETQPSRAPSSRSLLEGKFEAVSPSVSPSATHFTEAAKQALARGREKEKDSGFLFFRPKLRSPSPPSRGRKKVSDAPHLSLSLPVPKEERSRALGIVFEADPDAFTMLDEAVIGEKRLTPLETLVLVRACSRVIIERGKLIMQLVCIILIPCRRS